MLHGNHRSGVQFISSELPLEKVLLYGYFILAIVTTKCDSVKVIFWEASQYLKYSLGAILKE
jgi:hypothetical protein